MACNQGDCLGCKVNWGDFGQHFHKGCNNDLFFGDGSLYMPPKTNCQEVTCGMTTGLLQCSCTTKGKCTMKLDGEILRQSFRQKTIQKGNIQHSLRISIRINSSCRDAWSWKGQLKKTRSWNFLSSKVRNEIGKNEVGKCEPKLEKFVLTY